MALNDHADRTDFKLTFFTSLSIYLALWRCGAVCCFHLQGSTLYFRKDQM